MIDQTSEQINLRELNGKIPLFTIQSIGPVRKQIDRAALVERSVLIGSAPVSGADPFPERLGTSALFLLSANGKKREPTPLGLGSAPSSPLRIGSTDRMKDAPAGSGLAARPGGPN